MGAEVAPKMLVALPQEGNESRNGIAYRTCKFLLRYRVLTRFCSDKCRKPDALWVCDTVMVPTSAVDMIGCILDVIRLFSIAKM